MHYSVSNHQLHDCLLNRLFGCRSRKTSNIRVTGIYAGHSPVTGEFPAQMASNAENVSIWWRHHDSLLPRMSNILHRTLTRHLSSSKPWSQCDPIWSKHRVNPIWENGWLFPQNHIYIYITNGFLMRHNFVRITFSWDWWSPWKKVRYELANTVSVMNSLRSQIEFKICAVI